MTNGVNNLWCIDQQQAATVAPAQLGGKAHNLAFLSRFGFNVPQWWVVPVAAFELQLQLPTDGDDALAVWIQQQLAPFVVEGGEIEDPEKPATDVDAKQLAVVAEAIQQRLAAAGLHPDIMTAIR